MGDALHIKLICWDHKHVQVISEIELRSLNCAPVCTAPVGPYANNCGASIWAVQHEGEQRRLVGRPPHENWEAWADCIPQVTKPKRVFTLVNNSPEAQAIRDGHSDSVNNDG
jgi:hypothetical protein